MKYKYIFITGVGRCGTTLLRSLIDGHSKINVLPGELTNFLGEFLKTSRYSTTLSINDNIDGILFHFYNLFQGDSDYKDYRGKISAKIEELRVNGANSLSAASLLDNMCDAIFNNNIEAVLVDVTNENIRGLLDVFIGSKVIHLIRHPMEQMNSIYRFRYRDANLSFYRTFPGTWEFGDAFLKIFNSFREASAHKNNRMVLIVKLEDLQKELNKTVDSALDFIGLAPEQCNYSITRRCKAYDAGSTQISTKELFVSDSDWSCLLPNDLFVLSKFKLAASEYYGLPEFKPVKNSYFLFLLRQLGFIGKKRVLPRSPFRIIKIIIASLSEYIQDLQKKHYLNEVIDNYSR